MRKFRPLLRHLSGPLGGLCLFHNSSLQDQIDLGEPIPPRGLEGRFETRRLCRTQRLSRIVNL